MRFHLGIKNLSIMAVTTLKRKARRNSAKAEKKAQKIKILSRKPVIKKIEIEDLRALKAE